MHKFFLTIAAAILTACSSGTAGNSTGKAASETSQEAIEHPEFNADSAYSYLKAQVDFGPRVPGSLAHSACEQYLVNTLERFGAKNVTVQKATVKAFDGKELPMANVLASFNPDAAKRILLLAHYDTRPWADNDEDESKHNTPIDGANDGASGVAVLLEIARALGQSSPGVGVDIFFTDVEDYGTNSGDDSESTWCLGTQYWAANLPYAPERRPAYGILLDMVGGRNAMFHREYLSQRMAPDVVNRVWAIAANSPYASRFPNTQGGAITDDHIFVNSVGIPCIDIIESGNSQTGGFPPTWHTVDDTIDNIDASSLKAVGEVVLDVIYSEPIN